MRQMFTGYILYNVAELFDENAKPTLFGTSDRGTARLASTLRLSTICCSTESAASTLAAFMYVMKPNPRERLDTASFITIASATGPNCSK